MNKLKKTKSKTTKLPSIGSLEGKADALLQGKYTPLNPNCIVCGGQTSCMHHVIYKSQSHALRYFEGNLVPLCSKCHTRLHYSGDPAILGTIVLKKGQEWFDNLQQKRRVLVKWNKGYLMGIISELS